MDMVLSENQRLLTKYLAAVGCEDLAVVVIMLDMWDEDAVLEMLEFCASHPDATPNELLKASSEIGRRYSRKKYDYNIAPAADYESFKRTCIKIEEALFPLEKEKLLIDVDGSLIQVYYHNSGVIKVFSDYEVDAVYVNSEVELPFLDETEGIPDYQEYRKALVSLVCSIEEEVGMERENTVLLLHKLNTVERIVRFNEWVKSKMIGEKLMATETEICRAAVQIAKNTANNGDASNEQ